ncbi:hypothetical protein J6590_075398 [Homalodisca vitripennis]|nr:hypothetical protein J6590_075398 [Homalodisca vitripennis]
MFGIDLGTSYVRMVEYTKSGPVTVRITEDPADEEDNAVVRLKHLDLADDQTSCSYLASCPATGQQNKRRKYDASVATASKNWPFPVINCNGYPLIQCLVNGVDVYVEPQAVLYTIFKRLKRAAPKKPKSEPRFVIAIPGTYTYAHKRVVLKAAEDAKMVVEYLVNHTTAAAISRIIKYPHFFEDKETLIAIDLGAGSLTISAMNIVEKHLKVLSTVGESYWGGSDITNSVANFIFELHKKTTFRNSSEEVVGHIAVLCEEAKQKLIGNFESHANLASPYNACKITWGMIELANENRFKNIVNLLKMCVEEANIKSSPKGIPIVLLCGGSSSIKFINDLVLDVVSKSAFIDSCSQGRHLVAQGAAYIAAYLTDEKSKMRVEKFIIDEPIPTFAVRCLNNQASQIVSPRHICLLSDVTRTSGQNFKVSTKEPCGVRVKVYEEERTCVKNSVYVGTVQMLLPKCPDKARFKINVSLRIRRRNCHVYVHESATSTNENVDILRKDGFSNDFSAPEVQDLIALNPTNLVPLPADASEDSVDQVQLVGESSSSTVGISAALPQEESSVRIYRRLPAQTVPSSLHRGKCMPFFVQFQCGVFSPSKIMQVSVTDGFGLRVSIQVLNYNGSWKSTTKKLGPRDPHVSDHIREDSEDENSVIDDSDADKNFFLSFTECVVIEELSSGEEEQDNDILEALGNGPVLVGNML